MPKHGLKIGICIIELAHLRHGEKELSAFSGMKYRIDCHKKTLLLHFLHHSKAFSAACQKISQTDKLVFCILSL